MTEYAYKRRVDVGTDPVTGKRVRVLCHGNTQAELQRNIEIAKENFKRRLADQIFKGAELGNYAMEWLETFKNASVVEAGTRQMYQSVVKKIQEDAIGKKRMNNILLIDCQKFLNKYLKYPRTCEKIKVTLNQIFDTAVKNHLMKENPVPDLVLPKYVKTEKRGLTAEEKEAYRRVELGKKERMWLDILYALGLRPEELRALSKKDFDWDNNTLKIQRAQVWDGSTNPVLKGTKNNLTRTVPVPEWLQGKVKDYLADLNHDYLFAMEDGSFMTKNQYRVFTNSILDALNRELGGKETRDALNGCTFYTFRHNFCSALFYEGCTKGKMSTKMASKICGHSEMVFLQTYAHLDEEREWQSSVEVLNSLK